MLRRISDWFTTTTIKQFDRSTRFQDTHISKTTHEDAHVCSFLGTSSSLSYSLSHLAWFRFGFSGQNVFIYSVGKPECFDEVCMHFIDTLFCSNTITTRVCFYVFASSFVAATTYHYHRPSWEFWSPWALAWSLHMSLLPTTICPHHTLASVALNRPRTTTCHRRTRSAISNHQRRRTTWDVLKQT